MGMAKCLGHNSILNIKPAPKASSSWKRICKAQRSFATSLVMVIERLFGITLGCQGLKDLNVFQKVFPAKVST
ncbi:hypothetical protein PanWU01x14_359540 [Parasponia andersonii]|uniref:Uncharacterized protein n=1 Tax=Parasponia andersonii TaxID=3476 RepID=A0A2P5A7Y0_PARAD|nr:hypothetical protein PanWU01x14_359540 [Parasponia andersonii]